MQAQKATVSSYGFHGTPVTLDAAPISGPDFGTEADLIHDYTLTMNTYSAEAHHH